MKSTKRASASLVLVTVALLAACVPPPVAPSTGAEPPAPSTAPTPVATPDAATIDTATSSSGQIEQKTSGTLQGHVTIGPLQPVARVDEPTPVVPPEVYAARQIVVFATDGQAEIARVPIGPDGTYQVALPPGSYVVDINRAGIDSSKDLPAKVQIVAGQTTTLDVDIDTGIR